jgi:proteasome lid subunit RPN8/RPN11
MNAFSRPARTLRCSPLAWLKWQYLCHAGPTEVAGFGLSAQHDPLYLEDILVLGQQATASTVSFNDASVADLFDQMTDQNIPPHRFARIWLHSHPGASAMPSAVDEATFRRVFGNCDWSVMAILSRTSATYARIQFSAGPGGSTEIPIVVDWQSWAGTEVMDSHLAQWRQEYEQRVKQVTFDFWEVLEEEPTDVISDSIQPDLLSWSDFLDYRFR